MSKSRSIRHDEYETYAGMAHFAGTGPLGKTCGDCCHFERQKSRKTAFMTIEAACTKTRERGPRYVKPIPSSAAACTYFDPGAA